MRKVLGLMVLGLVFVANSAFAYNAMSVHIKGYIKGAEVTYKDADEITVRAGFGDCNGNFWELTSDLNVDLYSTLPTGEDFVYIYIDDSASTYPAPTIIGDTTEPVYSAAKMGWYNGNDRCIGAIYTKAGTRSILSFNTYSDGKIIYHDEEVDIAGNLNPTGALQFVEASDFFPVNSQSIYVMGYASDSNSNDDARVNICPYESRVQELIEYSEVKANLRGWLDLARGWSRDLYVLGDDNDHNNLQVKARGYQIER